MLEMQVSSLGWEDPPEKEMAAPSSIHAWEIPWTEEPGRLRPWSHKETRLKQLSMRTQEIFKEDQQMDRGGVRCI